MSKEFLDRLARGELTNMTKYREVKHAMHEMKKEDESDTTSSTQEWQNWELSPVWSAADAVLEKKPAEEVIKADSVQRAMDLLDK